MTACLHFIDVNGSNSLNATDVLLVVNDLLLHGSHATTAQAVPTVDPIADSLVAVVPEPASATRAHWWHVRGSSRLGGGHVVSNDEVRTVRTCRRGV